ncbi:MAG: hypothetical protein NUV48_15235, partial [Peptococcaceae bacterium]|nr:hypothetical protein [Peptococcaceae bacterium]
MTDMIGTPQYSDRIRQLETSDQGQPETWNPQLKKLIDNDAYLKEQNDTHQVSTGPHGATSAATANRIILRDANGRAKIAAPSEADDIARKDTVDNHANLTAPHSATPSPTPSRLVLRDAAGRAQVAAPAAAEDIARKDTVDTAKTEVVGSGWDGTTLKQLKDEHAAHLADDMPHKAVDTTVTP